MAPSLSPTRGSRSNREGSAAAFGNSGDGYSAEHRGPIRRNAPE